MGRNTRRAGWQSRSQRRSRPSRSPAARRAMSASPGSARWRRAGPATASPLPIRRCRTGRRRAGPFSGSRSTGCAAAIGARRPRRRPAIPAAARGSIPSPGSARLFGAAEGADRPAAEDTAPSTADTAAENAPPSGSAVREADAAASLPALAKKKSPPVEPAAAGLPDISNHADDDVSGDDLRTGEVVARIWIAPFVDANGVYREAAHVRVVLEPAGWRLK